MPDPRFEPKTPFSDIEIREIEHVLGRELPRAYCDFIKEYGGAFVGGLVDGSDNLPILSFFAASGSSGVLSKLALHPDLRDEKALPIADCELGNLFVLDQHDSVYYINYYNSKTVVEKVSDSFEEFISRIVVPEL
jgi:hypothetical protein